MGIIAFTSTGVVFPIRRAEPFSSALLIAKMAAEGGFTVKQIKSQSRAKTLVKIRHEIMLALWNLGHSAQFIGRLLDKDHTTVVYAVHKLGAPVCGKGYSNYNKRRAMAQQS